MPPNFYLYLTNYCNYKCLMCDFKAVKGGYFKDGFGEQMPLADWQRFIYSISAYKPAIFLPAPEPFLYKDIIPLLAYVKSHSLFCSVATNGSLLSRYAKELVDLGIDTLELSCDGPHEVHDKIRGVPGAFSNLIKEMMSIQKIKGNRDNPRINVALTVTHLNYDKIIETLDVLDGLGVKINFTISHLTYMPIDMIAEHNRKNDLIKINTHTQSYPEICSNINTEVLLDQLTTAKERKFNNIKNLFFSPEELNMKSLNEWYSCPSSLKIKSNCFFPWFAAQINFNGNVIMSPVCGPVIGNVTKESFVSLWNNRKFREIRLRLRKDKKYAPCFGCCSSRVF